jgi:antitoxin component HigA of HigAB toxin-antitoxin module
MYPNLRAEMARYGVRTKDLAETLGISMKSVNNRMADRHTGFTLREAFKIKDTFFPGILIEDLFAKATPKDKVVSLRRYT